MENKVKIYKLIDPLNNEIRYVGKTINTLNRRLGGHLSSTKRAKTYTSKWVNSLIKAGRKPVIELIEEVNENEWHEKEKFWIKYHIDIGCRLTNLCEGGKDSLVLKGKQHPSFGKKKPRELVDKLKEHLYKTAKRVVPFSEFDNVKQLYLSGLSTRSIAKKYNCCFSTISKIVTNMGIMRKLNRHPVKDKDIIYVFKLRKKGLNYSQIARIFKRDRDAIKTALKKYNQQQGETNA